MEVTTRVAHRGRAEVLASAAAGDEVAFRHIIAAHLGRVVHRLEKLLAACVVTSVPWYHGAPLPNRGPP